MRHLNDLTPSTARKITASLSTDGGAELMEFIQNHLEGLKDQIISTNLDLETIRFKQGMAAAYKNIVGLVKTAKELSTNAG